MERYTHQSSLWAGGLIGVDILMLQGFLALHPFDNTAYISIFAFAVGIPISACNILMNMRRGTGSSTPIPEVLFYSIGIIASLIGLAFAFLHICWIACVIFLVSTGVASFIYLPDSWR